MINILLTTTTEGVPFRGHGMEFTHPTVDFDIATEISIEEMRKSDSIQAAIDSGDITLKDGLGRTITNIKTYLNPLVYGEIDLYDVPHVFYADQMQTPKSSDWAVNVFASLTKDSNNSGLVVRRFDDTTDEGIGISMKVPMGVTNITLEIVSRAETAPGGAVAVQPVLYRRSIPDNGAVGTWSSGFNMTLIDLPTNENFQYDEQTVTIASLGLTAGEYAQFELVRDGGAGGDDLSGDWTLYSVRVRFS